MKFKKLFSVVIIALTFIVASCQDKKEQEKEAVTNSNPNAQGTTKSINEGIEQFYSKEKAIIKTAKGNITLRFFPKKAPTTVTRIQELIKEGFYNGLTFHRVIPNFVAQGGDPQGNGTGGSGKNLPAEFNDLKHEPGIVAMARSQSPDSADSQFYITLGYPSHLDGSYTIFARVVDGMEVAKQIAIGDKMLSVTLVDK